MQIDWLTTAAQIVNFFVLVWLLRRFLFRPVTRAIAARQAGIAEAVAEAEAREAAAAELYARLEAERAALEASVAERLAAAERDAEAHALTLRREAEEAEDRRRTELAVALEAERSAVCAALEAEAGRAGIEIARRVLADLADAPLESVLIRKLADRLAEEPPIARLAGEEPVAATLTCRWPAVAERDAALVDRLADELSRLLGAPVTLSVVHRPDAPAGASLEAGGVHASWTLEHHLDRIARRFEDTAAGSGSAAVTR